MNSMRGTIRRYLAALLAIVMIVVSVGAIAEDAAVESGESAATVEAEVKQESKPAEEKAAASEKKEEADKTPEKAKDEADEKAGDAPETKSDEMDESKAEAGEGQPAKADEVTEATEPAGDAKDEKSADPENGETDEEQGEGPDDASGNSEPAEDIEDFEDIEEDAEENLAGNDEEVEEDEELIEDMVGLVARGAEEEIDLGGVTSAIDNSTTLADGSYSAESFSFTGGTGRLTIACDRVVVEGGKAYATIRMSSSSCIYLKASGNKYKPDSTENGSTFNRVPVKLNEANPIIVCTTGMSTPKEISYQITVTLTEPKEEEPEQDDDAPDNSTDKADGDYTTGDTMYESSKLTITCEKITVRDGKAYATLVFSSTNYTYVKVAGVKYDTTIADGVAKVEIPVKLNEENAIVGKGKMGEIDYTITPTLADDAQPDEDDPEDPEDPENPEDPEESSGEQTDVESDSDMFTVVACTLYIDGSELRGKVTLSGTGYIMMYAGTKEEAAAGTGISYTMDAEGKFVFDVPVSALDTPIPYAAYSKKKSLWYDRNLTFKSDKLSEAFLKQIAEKTGVKPAGEEPEEAGEQTDVESDSDMFTVVACTLYIDGSELRGKVTLSGTGYIMMYAGTKEEAAAGTGIGYTTDAEGKYVFDVPVSALDTPIPYAAYSKKKSLWYDRNLTFKSDKLSENFLKEIAEKTGVKPAGASDDEQKDDEKKDEEQYTDTVGGSTSAVNNSTGLANGTYKPDSFSFSGGTGKVSISCSKITVSGGKTFATITFSSANYPYVKAGGRIIYGFHSGSTSTFEIPVALNQNNRILGMTTAMSANHEIEYTIYVGLKAALAASNTASDAEVDEKAEITGLRLVSKDKLTDAKLFSIYRYEDGFVMIDVVDAGRTLLVPEGQEAPVGLEDEVTLVQLPVAQAWIASEGAKALIDDAIEDTGDTATQAKLADLEADPLEPDYAALMMAGVDLIVLPHDFTDTDDRSEAAELVLERLGTLGIPAFVDRSLDEETEEARAEWIKVYAELLK